MHTVTASLRLVVGVLGAAAVVATFFDTASRERINPFNFFGLTVVLIRGATDGWVPYPFLDPATGYQSVGGYAVAIAVGFGIIGVAVWACSRLALVSVPDAAPRR